jgi:hypothetical protein
MIDETEWRRLLNDEEAARRATTGLEALSPDDRVARLKRYWLASARLARVATQEIARGNSVPRDLANLLAMFANHADAFALGQIPPTITDLVGPGKPQPVRRRQDLDYAVAYLRACSSDGLRIKGGMIKIVDRRSRRTVAESYGVTDEAVKTWKKRQLTALFPETLTEDQLRVRMQNAGRRYRSSQPPTIESSKEGGVNP